MRGFICVAGTLLFSVLAGAQSSAPPPEQSGPKRPMTFEDMMKMRRLGDIAVSPDGKWVLFSATDVDLDKNTKTSHLWIVPVAGEQEKPLTISMVGESRGRFSPDGQQIAFLTARDGTQQIWLADFDGSAGTIGPPHQFTQTYPLHLCGLPGVQRYQPVRNRRRCLRQKAR
jgi:WD40 repeat protein